jgi:hypothetical protein
VFDLKISTLTVFLISFVTIGFLHVFHWENLYNTQLIQGSYDVIDRTPAWRVNQSRLMGPAMLKVMTLLGISKWWAIRIFVLIFVLLNNLLFTKCISLLSQSKFEILNSLIIFNALFIIAQDQWLFVWDFIDITFFILYGLILMKNYYIKYLFIINFFHIFNRETALIMSIFFIYTIFMKKNRNLKELLKDKMFYGLTFNLFFGTAYTYLSRKYLFIRQSELTGGGQDLNNNFLGGNWVTPLYNYNTLFNGETVSNTLILTAVLLVFYFILRNYKQFSENEKMLSIATLINILPVFLFGVFIETRQYFPSLVMLAYLIFSNSITNTEITNK